MLKAVLFDLDGTLLDTIADINSALNTTLGTSFTNAQCQLFVGNGLMNAIKAALATLPKEAKPKDSLQALFDTLIANYKKSPAKYTKPYPGIESLLLELQDKGISLGVFSNKEQTLAQTIVQTCLPQIKFSMIIGMHGGYKPKPSSQAVLAFCKKAGCTTNEIIYIGDSEVDYATGMNAQVSTIILTYGMRSKEFLLSKGIPTTLLIDNIEELKRRLKEASLLNNPAVYALGTVTK